MVELISVTKRFGGRTVLADVSLAVQSGEVAIVCGPSGSGKTTLLRTLNRLEAIDAGDIRIDGESLYRPGLELRDLRAKVGLVFQQCHLFSHLSALDNVTMPLVKVKRLGRGEARAQALALFRQFGLERRAEAFPDELSGGERQRVAIVRSLALKPKVMLLDEPTSALDWCLRAEVVANVRALASHGIAQLIVTHDLDFACAAGDRFFLLQEGRLREVDDRTLACCAPEALRGLSSLPRGRLQAVAA